MYNGSFKTGEENVNLGVNSAIIGGARNYISYNADSITLVSCYEVVVNSDVVNFVGINIPSHMVITNKYNNSTLNGSDIPETITGDTTLTREYNGKTIYLDNTTNDITLTWDCLNMEGVKIYFIVKTYNPAYKFYIDSTGTYGTESFIGNALPYNTNLTQYEALPLTSLSDTIYVSK